MKRVIYRGTVIDPVSPKKPDIRKGAYVITEDSEILSVEDRQPVQTEGDTIVDFGENLIIPAFSDLHIHAPQFAERGIGMDCLLFEWLNRYTFPEEARFRERSYAETIYRQVIRELIRQGTLHLAAFTTIHYEASDLFFRLLEESGLYALAGKINMDRNSPDYYVEDTARSLADTERFVSEHLPGGRIGGTARRYSGRVRPILIPRFAPTCSGELLHGLGRIGQRYKVGVHTHLVESREEAAWAKELFPGDGSDGAIYENAGLLGNGPSIFAHVIFPTETEERILRQYGAYAVHCPDATSNITAGIMPAARLLAGGFPLALGTDVGGGHFTGVYRQVARAVQISKMKEFYEPEEKRVAFFEAFYMATAGGGAVFGNAGRIAPGYRFDALVIRDMSDEGTQLPPEESLERFCYIGDDRDILARYADGKLLSYDTLS